VQQKARRKLRSSQPARRLAVTGGGEIEQRQTLEERRIRHGCVEGRDQPLGSIQLTLGHSRTDSQSGSQLGSVSRAFECMHDSARHTRAVAVLLRAHRCACTLAG
jgi:hypothetical protein